MKAVVIHGKEDVRVEDVDTPKVEAGKVLLKGGFCGICGSDLHLYYAPEEMGMDFNAEHPITGAKWPQIFGHEFSGTVEEVGEGVEDIKVGDNVAVIPLRNCGECDTCKSGNPNICPKLTFDGIQSPTGGMAEYKLVDASQCFVLPEGTSLEMGALVEPMAVAYQAARLGKAEGEKVGVVVGGGPIGVGAYFALKSFGVEKIIVSEVSEERRKVFENFGAEYIVDPTKDKLVEKVFEISEGKGAGIVIDCAGAPAAFPDAVGSLGIEGRLVVAAVYEKPVEFNPYALFGNKQITMCMAYTHEDYAGVIDGIKRGVYTTEGGWVSTVEMEDVVDAIGELRHGKGMKVLVNTTR